MINLSNLRIDPVSLGRTKYLVSVKPVYKFNEQKEKTNEIEGYRYEVALPDHGFEKLGVKIPGEKMMEEPVGDLVAVDFTDLEIKAYIIEGKPLFSAKATKITKAKS